jgi:putative MATE family efflux protein
MTETPIGPLIASLAAPTIVSMLVTSIYNMADTFFVSKLGTSASGAVGVVFSLMAIIQAVGFTLGMGSGSWISRLLGARRDEAANEVASSGFFASIAFGLLLAAFGVAFIAPLMRVLGATDTILPYARDYGAYILLAAPVMTASFVLNNLLRGEGRAKLAMFGIAAGGVLNVLLDPLFIFGFGLGIAGAAVATGLSQCVGFAILLSSFVSGKTATKLSPAALSKSPGLYLAIIKNGLPSFTRQGLASVSTVALNLNAAAYGDAALAAMSIVGKVFMFIFSIILGIGQGYQPVVGFNYGAKRFDRVREAFSFTLKLNLAVMTAFAYAPSIMRLFIAAAPEVIRIGTTAFRAQCLAMPLIPLGVSCNMTFQSIGKSWTATFLSTARQGIFFLPLILILPRFIGLLGVQTTQPIADACTFLVCLPFIVKFFREMDAEEPVRRTSTIS